MAKWIGLACSLALATGCAGAAAVTKDGLVLLPIVFGNAELVTEDGSTCVSGGPMSQALAGLGHVVGSVFGGSAGPATQDTERQAGCLTQEPDLRSGENGLPGSGIGGVTGETADGSQDEPGA